LIAEAGMKGGCSFFLVMAGEQRIVESGGQRAEATVMHPAFVTMLVPRQAAAAAAAAAQSYPAGTKPNQDLEASNFNLRGRVSCFYWRVGSVCLQKIVQ
jgi:hypothetical protein